MKINPNYLPILIAVAIVFGLFLGGGINSPQQNYFLVKNSSKGKINRLLDFIDNEYVDDVKTDSIVDLAMDNILGQLDPHSLYSPVSKQTKVAEKMKGDFVGIGVNFYMLNDTMTVLKAIENGPSEKAGIKAGDRILYAGKTPLFGKELSSDSLSAHLKGDNASEVLLTIFRKSENKKFKINLKRGVVPIKSVDVALLLNKTTGYIKIIRFAETTHAEFKKALGDLKKQGINSLVIDLRDNGGGYMREAINIADELLKEDKPIVFVKNKKGTTEKTFATAKGDFEKGRVFLLINETSASASEILAGAIQDNDRGTIVGRRSFGKGLVQREMDFPDGSAVRLTIAKYYTPTGRSIQKSYVKGVEGYANESESRFENGELYFKDSIKTHKELQYKTPKGRIVYGGGGIVPDVFVPLEIQDSDENTTYLLQSGIASRFVLEQLDEDRNDFKGFTFEAFLAKMNSSNLYFDLFRKELYLSGIALDLEKNRALINRYLLAEFARQLYDEKKYYEVLLQEDPMIKRVLNK